MGGQQAPADFNQPAIAEKLKLLRTESAVLVKRPDHFHDIFGACADAGKETKT